MPRYDYRCSKCGHATELVRPITESAKIRRKCPQCGRRTLSRKFTGQFQMNLKPVGSKFPYISDRLPFNLPGETHHGRARKTVVKNAAHKDRLYKQHGFVTE